MIAGITRYVARVTRRSMGFPSVEEVRSLARALNFIPTACFGEMELFPRQSLLIFHSYVTRRSKPQSSTQYL